MPCRQLVRRSRVLLALSAATLGAANCDNTGPDGPVRIAWSASIGGTFGWQGVPAIAGGIAVVEDGSALLALDVSTGAQRWRTQLRQGVAVNADAIAIASGRVFTAGGDSVYALSLSSGARLWAFLPDDQAAACQLSADADAVYVGTRTHRVYALDALTGAVRWVVDIGPGWQFEGIVVGTAVVLDTVFVTAVQYLNSSGGFRAGHVIALDRTTGARLWGYVSPGQGSDASGAAGAVDGLLVVGDGYGSFFALDRATGLERWRVPTAAGFGGVLSTPVVQTGRIFAGSQGGVYAADLATGSVLWSNTEEYAARDVAVCNGVLLVQRQMIQALDPDNGGPLGSPLLDGQVEFPTSRIAVSGRDAIVVGPGKVYGLRC